MKAAKNKITPAQQHSNTNGHQPFFKKEGEGSFFSEPKKGTDYFFSPSTIQPKLTIGQPNDKYEVEADAMADKVVQEIAGNTITENTNSATGIQSKPADKVLQKKATDGIVNTEMKLQQKPIFESNADSGIQMKSLPSKPPIQAKESKEEEAIQTKEKEIQEQPILNTKEEEISEEVQAKEEEIQAQPAVQTKDDDVEEQIQTKENQDLSDHKADIQTKPIFESKAEVAEPVAQAKPTAAPAPINETAEEEIQEKEEEELSDNELDLEAKPMFDSGAESPPDENNTVQANSENTQNKNTAPPDLENQLATSSGGQVLPFALLHLMENAFGVDFSQVRIHTGGDAIQMNKTLHAQAFAYGANIYFNQGKYDPTSSKGLWLLAHELTHVVQQGGSDVTPKTQKKAPVSPSNEATIPKKVTAINTGVFTPSQAIKTYIEAAGSKGTDIRVKFGNLASGTLKIRKYKDSFRTKKSKHQAIVLNHSFLSPLLSRDLQPVLAVKIRENNIRGYITYSKIGKLKPKNKKALIKWIRENPKLMKWAGLDKIKLGSIVNQIEGKNIRLEAKGIKARFGGFVKGIFNISLINSNIAVEGSTTIKVKNLADGHLEFKRDEEGNLKGQADLGVNFKNFNGSMHAEFLNGMYDIQGKVSYSTEKLRGEVNLIVTDAKKARGVALQHLEPKNINQEAVDNAGLADASTTPQPGPRAIAGWGDLDFSFNDWLTGNARVIVDNEGHVTVQGDIIPQAEIILFEGIPWTSPDFVNISPKFRYGLPYVASVYIGLTFQLYAEAQIGPALLRNIKIHGTYSTDPLLFNDFRIEANFHLPASAALVLKFGIGGGIEVLFVDVSIFGNITGKAGIKAYLDVNPVFGYREVADPTDGKKGEFFMSGQAEIAAQPFLGLSGSVDLTVDPPWPFSDKSWSWPVFDKEYPLPGEFGLGVNFGEYVIGSGKMPEINTEEVTFDTDKFSQELLDKKLPPKQNNGQLPKQAYKDKLKGEKVSPLPSVKAQSSTKEKKKEELFVPTDAILAKWAKGIKAIRQLKNKAEKKPYDAESLSSILKSIKRKYKFTILSGEPSGQNWAIYAEMKGKNNRNNLIGIRGLPPSEVPEENKNSNQETLNDPKKENTEPTETSSPEKKAKIAAGIRDINKEEKTYLSNGKILKEDAEDVVKKIKKKHSVFVVLKIVDGRNTWDYYYKASPGKIGKKTLKEDAKKEMTNGWILFIRRLTHYTENKAKFIEERNGKEKIGYKVDVNGNNGFVVGDTESKYVTSLRKAKKKRDKYKKEYTEKLDGKTIEERRSHIRSSGDSMSNEEKIEIYDLILEKAKISKFDYKGELTNKIVSDYRHYMIKKVAAKFPKKLKSLDETILHNSDLTGKVGNKILGSIFEEWVGENVGNIDMTEIIFKDDKGSVLRRADGRVKGKSILVEVKSVKSKPSSEQITQMRAYANIINKEKGYLAKSKGRELIKFSSIRYYFNSQAAADMWKEALGNNLEGMVDIFVGDEKIWSL